MGKVSLVAALFVLAGGEAGFAGPAALDQGLFATFDNFRTQVFFEVCGSLPESSGCYGGAYLKTFDYACGVLQGTSKTHGNTITRAIYVLDKRTNGTDDVMLYIFERKDVISSTYDGVSAKLKAEIDLGVTGGSGAHCMLAGNRDCVYAGTDASAFIVSVSKHSETLSPMAGQRAGDMPVSITADQRGYVVLNYTHDFTVVDPDGQAQEEGGGNNAFINTRNGWIQN